MKEPVVQRRELERRSDNPDPLHTQYHARILTGKSFHDRREERSRDPLMAPEPDFAHRRVGQELDVPYGLLELIEHHVAALQQRPAIHRGLDTLRPAIEQPHTKRVLEVADRL